MAELIRRVHHWLSYMPSKVLRVQGNLGLKNPKGPKILFFIAGILLLLGIFTIELTTEGL
jgi:hypothetical protein